MNSPAHLGIKGAGRLVSDRRGIVGGLCALAVVLGAISVAWACVPQAVLTLNPGRGAAGSVSTATGSNFPDGTVEIRWDSKSGTVLGSATPTAGNFETSITIPPGASPGFHVLVAVSSADVPDHSAPPVVFEVTGTSPAIAPGETATPKAPAMPARPPLPGFGGVMAIIGTSGPDTLTGTQFDDVIKCGAGNDTVRGRGGNDVIKCGPGNDRIEGGPGNDRILGQSGNDKLLGGSGNDKLMGGTGRDTLRGDAGKDRLFGGSGADRLFRDPLDLLSGGPGRDRLMR